MIASETESQRSLAAELVRRGLPVDYAERMAAELADHHRDLVAQLRTDGIGESAADEEAWRRLGSPRTLINRIVREYQQRHWYARWPLVTFLLGPIPALVAIWCIAGLGISAVVEMAIKLGLVDAPNADAAFKMLPFDAQFAFLIGTFLAVPALVVCGYVWLVNRSALDRRWILLVACILGVFMGVWKLDRIGPGSRITMQDRQTLEQLAQPSEPEVVLMLWLPIDARNCSWSVIRGFFFSSPAQLCQLLFPAAVAGALVLRAHQLSRRRESLIVGGC